MKHAAPCPLIETYERHGAKPSKAPRWIAKWADGGTLLNPTFEGRTEADAIEAAREFWNDEQVALRKARHARREAA